jgi:hypothetical protein
MSMMYIIIFRLLTTLSFNSVPNDPFTNKGGNNPEINRIKIVIQTIENYGVNQKYIFKLEDLYEKKNIPKVVRCLEEIEKLAMLEEHINLTVLPTNKVYF